MHILVGLRVYSNKAVLIDDAYVLLVTDGSQASARYGSHYSRLTV